MMEGVAIPRVPAPPRSPVPPGWSQLPQSLTAGLRLTRVLAAAQSQPQSHPVVPQSHLPALYLLPAVPTYSQLLAGLSPITPGRLPSYPSLPLTYSQLPQQPPVTARCSQLHLADLSSPQQIPVAHWILFSRPGAASQSFPVHSRCLLASLT